MSAGAGRRPGVGIDLIEIERIERAIARRPRLAARLFTERELAYAGARRRPARHLAARFAAKEAVVKAFGHSLVLREIEVAESDPPRIELHGRAAELARAAGVEVSVSLTHSREQAAAVAMLGPAA